MRVRRVDITAGLNHDGAFGSTQIPHTRLKMLQSRHKTLQRRAQRQRQALQVGPVTISVAVVLSVSFLWMAALGIFSVWKRPSSTALSLIPMADLWLDDTRNRRLGGILHSCVDEDCRQELIDGQHRVAVLQTPGVIGRAMNRYIDHVLLNATELDVRTSNRVPDQVTTILRIATLPVALEAIDLALVAAKEDTSSVTMDDILDIVHRLSHWHCQSNANAASQSLLTLTPKQMLAHPGILRSDLLSLVGIDHSEHKDVDEQKWMQPIIEQVIRRLDECEQVANQWPSLEEMVENVLAKALPNGQCPSVLPRFRSKSHITKVVETYFSGDGS